ncbi:MAG: hypothetical protein ACKODX_08580 [Gemmata sp.]
MTTPPVTFPCPFCSRRMGVPSEFLGRQVRCPHCKNVLLAPATDPNATSALSDAPVPAAPVPAAPVPPPPAPAEVELELRPFKLPTRKEGADSILSEPDESDDEVFGSLPGVRLGMLPSLPGAEDRTELAPDELLGFGLQPAAPAQPPPAAPAPEPVAPSLATTAFDMPPDVAHKPPAAMGEATKLLSDPAQAPAPQPKPVATQPPAYPPACSNPFADFEPEPVPAPVPMAPAKPVVVMAPVQEPPRARVQEPDEEPAKKPARGQRVRSNSGGGAGKTILLVLLAAYGFVATLLAVYGLFFKSGSDDVNPLSTVPDNFGEFDPVSRKKVSQYKFRTDSELPAAQRATLGAKVVIGQIEVRPMRVEKRQLHLSMEGTDEREKKQFSRTQPALVMTLDIKNNGDLPIFPMDPAFTRRASGADKPLTRLVIGPKVYAGGEIEWPLPSRFKKKIEQQQANDSRPLLPGHAQEYVVFTEGNAELVRAAETSKELLQWRVQVRRGLVDYKGKEVPVTAVIGVDFKGSEIQPPAGS